MAEPGDPRPRRIQRLRRSFRRLRVDAALITGASNVTWLTGFTGDSSALLLTRDAALFLTDGRYTEQAEHETSGLEIVRRKRGMMDLAARQTRRLGVRRLGIESSHMSVASHVLLVRSAGGTEVKPMDAAVERLRQVKDATEKQRIREAIHIAEQAFAQVRQAVRPGRTEKELARMLEAAMTDLGAECPAFPTIVAAAERTSLPHAQPTDRAIESGDAVLFDWGARRNGYASDLTRMLYVDTIASFYARVHPQVLEAQRRALRAARPGLTADSLDRAARDFLKSKRRGKYFSHSLGHGIGLQVHEGPTISAMSRTELRPGMVFTVEPGVYLPGRGGVRIEDDVLVTGNGSQTLTSAPKSLRHSILRTRAQPGKRTG